MADLNHRWAGAVFVTPCKRCGTHTPPHTRCSYCGGYGIVGHESPHDCPNCWGSGHIWPPRCNCGAFRAVTTDFLITPDT
jgi:hypothetical protein